MRLAFRSQRGAISWAPLFLVLLLTASGVAAEDNSPKLLVLLPLNVEEVPPEFLAHGTEVLDAVLADELRRRDMPFTQLSLAEGVRGLSEAVGAVGGLFVDVEGVTSESVERARHQLITSLVDKYAASGVVWPDIHSRRAKKKGRRLTWDGATLSIPGGHRATYSKSPQRGSSLRVRIFDADANLIHDVYRGLEVIDTFRLMRLDYAEGRYLYRYAVRDDLFEDRSTLDEAARIALLEAFP